MRANYRWLCAALLGCWLTSPALGQQAISWQPNPDTAKRLAAQTNRLVLIHFWSTSCGPCQQMEREVFPRPEVAAAIEAAYVPVKLNVDYFPATARQYGITRLPTDVVLTPQGQVIETHEGALIPTAYIGMLNHIAAAARPAANAPQIAAAAVPGPMAPSGNPRPGTSGYPSQDYVMYSNPGPSAAPPAAQPAPSVYGPGVATTTPAPTNPPTMAPGTGIVPSGVDPRYGAAPQAVAPPMGNQVVAQPGPAPGVVDANQPRSTWAPASNGVAAPVGPAPGMPNNWPLANNQPAPGQALPGQSAAGTPPTADAAAVPAGNPPLGLDGYCPVQLMEKERWVKGNPRWGLVHRGRTYLFAGPDEQNRFYADPDRYAPAASGNDVVMAMEQGQTVSGRREHGVWFEGRVYLFASEDSLRRFDAAPYRYSGSGNPTPPAATEANRGMGPAPGQARY